LAGCLVGLHVIVGTVGWMLPLTLPWRIILVLCLLLSLLVSLRTHCWMISRRSVRRLVWDESDAWWLTGVDGVAKPALLRGDSLVTTWLVVLLFQGRWPGVRTVLLTSGSLDAESLRRLRVRLRLAKHTADNGRSAGANSGF